MDAHLPGHPAGACADASKYGVELVLESVFAFILQ
jgi:hypothetical protein